MKGLPKLVYEQIDAEEKPWLIISAVTGEYDPRTNRIKIYYSRSEVLPLPKPFRRFVTMFHEFIHWLLPSYQSRYPLNVIGIYLHTFNDAFHLIVRALYNRDKGWIYPYGKDARLDVRTIERGNAKGLIALLRKILHEYFMNYYHACS